MVYISQTHTRRFLPVSLSLHTFDLNQVINFRVWLSKEVEERGVERKCFNEEEMRVRGRLSGRNIRYSHKYGARF